MKAPSMSRYWDQIEALATGRTESLFLQDFEQRKSQILEETKGASVAVIGAAGSIGSEVVKIVAEFPIKRLVLFDISENNLVEVTRDIRGSSFSQSDLDLQVLPIGMGDPEFDEVFKTFEFQYVLNFSAMKHVRSEKDVFCLRRMLRTNVFSLDQLFESLNKNCKKVFSVSSDKAVNPSNLMGASKNIMEQTLMSYSDTFDVSSARFANVSFSDGSLPSGFLKRIQKKQALAAPSDVKRYFISHREAAELSILAAFSGKNREVFFPLQEGNLPEISFSDIAIKVLEFHGYTPVLCDSAEEAKQKMSELLPQNQWPCYFSESNTTGEKYIEEFIAESDRLVEYSEFKNMNVVEKTMTPDQDSNYKKFIDFYKEGQLVKMSKADLVVEIKKLVPELNHIEVNRNLDSKM